MTHKTLSLTPTLYEYILATADREPAGFKEVRAQTAVLKQAKMQIAPEQGQFMALLVKLLKAKNALEIGVFTGYSGLWIASSLPPDGKLVACEINETWANMALANWQQLKLEDKIDLRLGPALTSLNQLLVERGANSFDFIFIDADKENQAVYYELALELLVPGGMIVLDNSLWYGKVADLAINDKTTVAIRELNAKLRDDARVDISLIAVGDGLMLARKK